MAARQGEHPQVIVPLRLDVQTRDRANDVAYDCRTNRSAVLKLAIARGLDAAEREIRARAAFAERERQTRAAFEREQANNVIIRAALATEDPTRVSLTRPRRLLNEDGTPTEYPR